MTITSTPIPPFDEMRAEVLAMFDEHPDWWNPTGGDDGSGPCVYLWNGRRCAIGEYLHVKGVPDVILAGLDGSFEEVAHGIRFPIFGLSDVHVTWLNRVQSIADGCADLNADVGTNYDHDEGPRQVMPRSWGEVVSLIRAHPETL